MIKADLGKTSKASLAALFKPVDCSTMFEVLTALREVFFDNLLHQSFEGEGVNLSDSTGFKIVFKPDPTLIEYYEGLECRRN